jgi:integrase
VCDLQWHQIELSEGRLHVRRVKNGTPSVHPIRGDEMRALRKLRREHPSDAYVFVSERGGPMSPTGFHRLIQRLGETAKMPIRIHPHMLRHACGYKLAKHPAHRPLYRVGRRHLISLEWRWRYLLALSFLLEIRSGRGTYPGRAPPP